MKTNKIKFQILLFTVCLLLLANNTYSQKKTENIQLSPRQLIKLAENAHKRGDIYSASDYYEKYCEIKPYNYKAAYNLAEVYRKSRNYENAKKWYSKVYENSAKEYLIALFYKGQMQKMTGEYKEAKESFTTFMNNAKNNLNLEKFVKLSKIEIEGCEMALIDKSGQSNIEISHLNATINSAYIDYSPLPINENTMLYASLPTDEVKYYDTEKLSKLPVRKFFIASGSGTNWTGGNRLKGSINNSDFHTGNGALSPNGERLYFTRTKKRNNKKYISNIYVSKKRKDKWRTPEKLDKTINSTSYTSTQPAIGINTSNTEFLYFVSDQKGGFGGLDIWIAEYDSINERYSKPVNAGNKINTTEDEMTPFYDCIRHKLYFSSDGRAGYGGFDIFSITGESNNWKQAVNMGNAINSSADDTDYITFVENANVGFFVSNRTGSIALKSPNCCDDIYAFVAKKEEIIGEIIDEEIELEYLDLVDINYIPEEAGIDDYTYTTDIDSLTISLKKGVIPKKAFILDNIYYNFNKSTLTDKAKTSIDTTVYKLLIAFPDIVVELGSHTDSYGSDEYNLTLSDARAKSVVKYLITKGIKSKRLVPKGYGESQPVATNKTAKGRQKNRRTELHIIN